MQQKINVQRLAYVHYEHADFAKWDQFAEDFGLVKGVTDEQGNVYYHGYGKDLYCYIATPVNADQQHDFKAAGFVAKTRYDFDIACKFPGATIHDISGRPGGGEMVEITDPNGYAVQVIWGMQEKAITIEEATSSITGETAVNGVVEKNRKGFRWLKRGPAMVHKLGHYGFMSTNYDETCNWYGTVFNLELVDVLNNPDVPSDELARFYRLSLGNEYVDHHCMILTREKKGGTRVHHSSFEVEDFDTQLLGHDWLKERNYQLFWGVGRHVHGSQVFDYWKDTSGYVVEHYADGDVVNDGTPVTKGKFGNGSIWGPRVPDFGPKHEGK